MTPAIAIHSTINVENTTSSSSSLSLYVISPDQIKWDDYNDVIEEGSEMEILLVEASEDLLSLIHI